MRNEVVLNARQVFSDYTVNVRVTGVRRAIWMLRLGAIFIRFGCWLANLGYEESE